MVLSCDLQVANVYPQPETVNFYYFNTESKTWKPLRHLNAPPQKISTLTVVGKTLYAVGGRYWDLRIGEMDMSNHTFVLDHKENRWKVLPQMRTCRDVDAFRMVYMDGFIYTVGGKSWANCSDVERFNIANESWESLAPIPYENGADCQSAVAVDGKILVLVVYRENIMLASPRHHIYAYDPEMDSWQTAYSKQQTVTENAMPGRVLFVYGGVLYRVMYIAPDDGNDWAQLPVVNVMNLRISRNTVRVTEGDSVTQDLIPVNTIGAFCIHNEVFMNVNGFVAKTDLKIREDQDTKVDLNSWKKFSIGPYQTFFTNSNIVYFPVDKKLLV